MDLKSMESMVRNEQLLLLRKEKNTLSELKPIHLIS